MAHSAPIDSWKEKFLGFYTEESELGIYWSCKFDFYWGLTFFSLNFSRVQYVFLILRLVLGNEQVASCQWLYLDILLSRGNLLSS